MEEENIFTITPMSRKIELEPGEVYEGTVTVFNPVDAKEDFAWKVSVAPYSVESGTYNADLAAETEHSQITKWITFDKVSGVLAPNEKAEIHYTITVPETAAGGGQYAAIMVGSDAVGAAAQGISIQNIYEMASIIYARINGEIKRAGSVGENKIPGFVTAMPITVSVELENDGNVHETAKIRTTVKNFLNGAQIYPLSGEEGIVEEVMMPDTSRYVTRDINDLSPVGIYEVTQSVTYLGQTSDNTQLVVACPVWFMLLVALTFGVIVFGIVRAIMRHRRIKRSLM